MASNILHFRDSPGAVDYAVILDDTGQVWNGSAMAAYAVGSWATYAVLLSVPDAAGHATLTLPALPAGNYTVDVRRRAGGTAAATDTQVGTGDFVWNGTKILTVADAAGGGGGSDPWATALPGSYGAGTAGNIVGTNLDARVSTRSTLGGTAQTGDNFARLGAPAGASIAADIATRAAPGAAMTLTTGERDAIANALLDLANGVETGATVRSALREIAASVSGVSDGAVTGAGTMHFKDIGTGAKSRLTAAVDGSGNRTSVTRDRT